MLHVFDWCARLIGGFVVKKVVGTRPVRPVSLLLALLTPTAILSSFSLPLELRVRFHIIGNARIKNVGKSQSCLVSKLPIIWKRTRSYGT